VRGVAAPRRMETNADVAILRGSPLRGSHLRMTVSLFRPH
jgi:hypothetical protein